MSHYSQEDDKGQPEQDPTEEVKAEAGDATFRDCESRVGEEQEDGSGLISFREEVADAYQPERDVMVPSPEDGLPIPAGETSVINAAPPFTIDSVVCVEDEREWAELFDGEFTWPSNAAISRGFQWEASLKYTASGNEVPRRVFPPSRVVYRFGQAVVELSEAEGIAGTFLPVRPIRPRCEFYKRQVFSNDAIPDVNEIGHQIVFRNCTARRSVGGAFLSLRDEAVYACDHRMPPDPRSAEKHLDSRDRERLRSEAHKVHLPLFKKA